MARILGDTTIERVRIRSGDRLRWNFSRHRSLLGLLLLLLILLYCDSSGARRYNSLPENDDEASHQQLLNQLTSSRSRSRSEEHDLEEGGKPAYS